VIGGYKTRNTRSGSVDEGGGCGTVATPIFEIVVLIDRAGIAGEGSYVPIVGTYAI
jgi:hypothetical protein